MFIIYINMCKTSLIQNNLQIHSRIKSLKKKCHNRGKFEEKFSNFPVGKKFWFWRPNKFKKKTVNFIFKILNSKFSLFLFLFFFHFQ